VSVDGGFWEALRAGHDSLAPRDDDLVLVHDQRYPLATESLERAVLTALRTAGPDVAAAIPTRPVIDTLKWVDGAGYLVGTAPRDTFRTVVAPQAYRGGALARALAASRLVGSDDSVSRLPEQIRLLGGGLVTVEAPAEVFEVTSSDDVILAEALDLPAA
jgi:2-C-methyl-D-erythritol 4-phosphate cytidylyltransferase